MQRTSLLSAAAILAALSMGLLIPAQNAQAQTEAVLYNLCSVGACSDGGSPSGSLVADGYGNLYGTTQSGGTGGCAFFCIGGTVFELSAEPEGGCPNGTSTGNGWCENVLYNFCSTGPWPYCPDGIMPYATLTLERTGTPYNPSYNIYGTTFNGGVGSNCQDTNGCGIVFELSPEPLPIGSGCPSGTYLGNGWCEKVLYNFCNQTNCTDGAYPTTGLVENAAGNLFGTTPSGVYELSPNGTGGWTQSSIYSDNYPPQGGLAIDTGANLYGVDSSNVFELSWVLGFGGHFHWVATNIHTFPSSSLKDGSLPVGTPAVDSAGNVYGTTVKGGSLNYGTVWKLSPVTSGTGAGTYKERILHSFTSVKTGYYPQAGVTLDSAGNIYGTTTTGGKYYTLTQCQYPNLGNGCGTVFKLALSGSIYTYKLLWSFNDASGAFPFDAPILRSSGYLYGTALEGGGPNNGGTVFAVNPSAAATTITITSSLNPSISGQAVTFTATVSSSAGAPPDGETVKFMKGTASLGTGTLSGGVATFTTSSLAVGTSAVHAVYGGDLNFVGSTSKAVDQVVEK